MNTDNKLELHIMVEYTSSQHINIQNVNIADETLTDYSFLSRYHYTISKN